MIPAGPRAFPPGIPAPALRVAARGESAFSPVRAFYSEGLIVPGVGWGQGSLASARMQPWCMYLEKSSALGSAETRVDGRPVCDV